MSDPNSAGFNEVPPQNKPSTAAKRWGMLVIALIVIFGAILIFTQVIDDDNDADDRSDRPVAGAGTTGEAGTNTDSDDLPAIKIDAAALLTEVTGDPDAAQTKYDDRNLEISGTVATVEPDPNETNESILTVTGADGSATITCTDMDQADLGSAQAGDTVTLVGEWDSGSDEGVLLDDCQVL